MKQIPVKINKGTPQERMIGMLYPDTKEFIKTVYESKHLFRIMDAWGIDSDYFTRVLLPNNYTVRVQDLETKKTYITTSENIKKNGQFYHFKNESLDDYAQIFLARKFWDIPKPETEEEYNKRVALATM